MATRTRNRWHGVAVAGFVAAIAGDAQAADGSTNHDAAAASADVAPTLVVRGVKLYKEHQYEAAREAFAQAYELDAQPGTILNLALAELKADQPVGAAVHFREYLNATNEPAAKLESVRTTYLPLAESQIAEIDVYTSSSAEILVDGSALGPTMVASERAAGDGRVVSIRVRAGEHGITARRGSSEQTHRVVVKGGERVEVHLEPAEPEPRRAPLPPSPRVVQDEPPGDDSGRERPRWVTVIALGSGALALAGLGVGLAVGARNQASDAQAAIAKADPQGTGGVCFGPAGGSSWCMRLNDETTAARRNWTLSMASYVGAGVLGAASVATWMLWPSISASKAGARLTPVLSARGGGFVLDGAW